MKSFIASLLILVSFKSLAGASDAYYLLVKDHLKQYGHGRGEIVLEKETQKSFYFLEIMAIDDGVDMCHIGVVVDKASGEIVLGEQDRELDLALPYSIVFVIKEQRLAYVCAD